MLEELKQQKVYIAAIVLLALALGAVTAHKDKQQEQLVADYEKELVKASQQAFVVGCVQGAMVGSRAGSSLATQGQLVIVPYPEEALPFCEAMVKELQK